MIGENAKKMKIVTSFLTIDSPATENIPSCSVQEIAENDEPPSDNLCCDGDFRHKLRSMVYGWAKDATCAASRSSPSLRPSMVGGLATLCRTW